MKIIVSESGERKLLELFLKEELNGMSDKVNIVKKYLDDNFVKADMDSFNKDGEMTTTNIVIMLDARKQPSQHKLSIEQLFDRVQYKFQNIIGDKDERDKFLRQVIDDWFNNKISKYGSLTNY